MLKEIKLWAGYITAFILVTLFVTSLLELAEWAAKLVKHPTNPIYLAAAGICAFLACLKLGDEQHES